MAARFGKDRFGRTPREYVLDRLVEALEEHRPGLSAQEEDEILDLALSVTNSDTVVVRALGACVHIFSERRRCRSFSVYLARYIDGLNPVAKSRLFAEARRRRGLNDGASD